MIARNLKTRIVKLEASRRRPDELLLVWRRPNGPPPVRRSLHPMIASSAWSGSVTVRRLRPDGLAIVRSSVSSKANISSGA